MRFPRKLRKFWRIARRRALVGGSLVAMLVASVGLPMPRPADLSGGPYPCQGHACGCHSAEDCWRHCCCFNTEQKLAWARAQGVVPPAWLVAQADAPADNGPLENGPLENGPLENGHADHEHAVAANDHAADDHAADSHAADNHAADNHAADNADSHDSGCGAPVASCCAKHRHKRPISCQTGQTDGASRSQTDSRSNATSPADGWEIVTAAAYGHCHGGQSLWTVCKLAPAPPVAAYRFEWFVIERLAISSQRAESSLPPPPTPPPRCV